MIKFHENLSAINTSNLRLSMGIEDIPYPALEKVDPENSPTRKENHDSFFSTLFDVA